MAKALNTSLVVGSNSTVSPGASERARLCALPIVQACGKSTLRQAAMRIQKRNKQARTGSQLLHRHGFHSLYHESIQSARLPTIRAQMVEFKAKREVALPFREGTFPAVEYLNELERVVKVTFPDSSRITYLGDSLWRTRLKPITFFTLSATPVCEIKVFNKGNTLQIHSDRLLLDLSGLPEEHINQTVRFRLIGQLQVDDARKRSQYKAGRQAYFNGSVQLRLMTSLPLPFSLLPENVVTTVGDTILDTILGAMESALVRGIIADYHTWCRAKQSTEATKKLEKKKLEGVTGTM